MMEPEQRMDIETMADNHKLAVGIDIDTVVPAAELAQMLRRLSCFRH